MSDKPIIRDKFDFEVGQLVRSPCNGCEQQEDFPKCFNDCKIIETVREILAKGISSTYSSYES